MIYIIQVIYEYTELPVPSTVQAQATVSIESMITFDKGSNYLRLHIYMALCFLAAKLSST